MKEPKNVKKIKLIKEGNKHKRLIVSLAVVTLPLLGTYSTSLHLVGKNELVVYAEETSQTLTINDKGVGSSYEKYLDPDTDNYITLGTNYNRFTSDANNAFIVEIEKATGTMYAANLAVKTRVVTNRTAIPTDGTIITIDNANFSIGNNGTTFAYISKGGEANPFVRLYENNRSYATGTVNFGSDLFQFGEMAARYIPQKKNINVLYQDQQGNLLSPMVSKTGFDTVETYSVVGSPVQIPGYNLLQSPTVLQGQVSQDDAQNTITYIYAFDADAHKVTINGVQAGATVVTGTGIAGDKITITDKAGNVIGAGEVEQDGTFTISLTSDIQAGDTLTATPEKFDQKGVSTETIVEKNAITDQKETGKAAIDQAANDTKTAIDHDPTLTADEKTNQKNAVDTEADNAKTAIDNGTTADEIQTAVDTGTTTVKDQYKPGTSLDDQKTAGKAAIDQAANDTKTAIDHDPTLTADEKTNQKNAVDTEADNAKAAIDSGTTADEIQTAVDTGTTAVQDQYKPGTSLDDQKAAGKAAIDQAVNDTKTAIDNDPTLTADEKTNQKNAVDTEADNAKTAIDNSTTADDVKAAVATGITTVQDQYKPGTNLDDQKTVGKAAIDQAANDTKTAIDHDPTLTTDEKTNQKIAVDTEATNAKTAIDNSTTAVDIQAAVSDGLTTVKDQYKPGTSLDDQKTAGKAAIDQAVNDTKTAIDNDPTLTADEKTNQKNAVDTEADNAKTAIDKGTTADDIQLSVTTGTTTVKDQYKPGTSLDDQKTAGKAAIDQAVNDTKTAIDHDSTLTADEKTNQKNAVDTEADNAKTAIDNSTTAVDIQTAVSDGIATVKDQYKPGTSLDDQKTAGKAAIDQAVNDTKTAIDNDPTLTADEKTNQKNAVDTEADNAKTAIDKGTTADEVKTAVATGTTTVKDQYKPGTSLDDQKTAGKAAIDQAANDTKTAIDMDSTLTADEKAKQKAAVDTAANNAKTAIDSSTTPVDIQTAAKDGVMTVKDQYKPGSSLDDQKTAGKAAIDQAANDTKAAIDNDATLTSDEKAKQKAAVDIEADKAKAAIDNCSTADAIQSAVATGVKQVKDQYKPGTSVVDPNTAEKDPADPAQSTVKTTNEPSVKSENTAISQAKSLPNTGEKETNELTFLGMMLAMASASLLYFKKRTHLQRRKK